MPLDKKRQETLRKFVVDRLWPAYPSDLCGSSRNKGSRGEAIKSLIKINPDDAEIERIMQNLLAQVKYDREAKASGEEVYRWPYASTYLNQSRYDDEISGSHAELKLKESAVCKRDGCNSPVHGPSFAECTDHYAESVDTMRGVRIAALKRNGLYIMPGESKPDYYKRCREFCSASVKKRGNHG